jgi:hypothetical protein
MSIEAMKQALEALEEIYRTGDTQAFDLCYAPNVIPALRQAIAEAEKIVPSDYPNSHQQERHVSYVCPNCHWSLDKQVRTHTPEDVKKIESKWVGLTDHELQVLDFNDPERGKLARAVEAKLKERNT